MNSAARRQIPAVSTILDALNHRGLPRPFVVEVVRRKLSEIRATNDVPRFESIVAGIRRSLDELHASRLKRIVNGTGIVIHTNFGRAPLASEAIRALHEIGSGYSSLEYDLATGERGRRGGYVETALALLCEAEAATMVNNCAAALVLIVNHFTNLNRQVEASRSRAESEVIISRGELVQIGGGFRIGEILEASGAKLREVGATNKTTLEDYAHAIGPETAMILKVHRSNFFMGGFVESPSSKEISALARKKRIAFVEDLGSGAMFATESLGIAEHEPTPAEVLKSGADLVCFSGDKLFGGPQAGIIVGRKRLVTALKREPLFRALRCDKLVSCRVTDDCGSPSRSKDRRNANDCGFENLGRCVARPCCGDFFKFAGIAGNHWNRSRQSEGRRWHFAELKRALSDNRYHSREFIGGRVCGNSSCIRSAGHRLHCRRAIQARYAHHLS